MYRKCLVLAIMVVALSSSSAYPMKNNPTFQKFVKAGLSGAKQGAGFALVTSLPLVLISKDSPMSSLAYPAVATGLGMAGGFIVGAGASLTHRNVPTAMQRAAVLSAVTGTVIGLSAFTLFYLGKIGPIFRP